MIYFIGSGPGDPELFTLKGRRILGECPVVIYAGSLVNREILQYARPDAVVHDSSRLHLEEIVAIMEDAYHRDQSVARLHSGDPSLYGSIREQMEALAKRGIPFEVIPGVSSFQAAAARLRRELTVPEVTQTVILTRLGRSTPVPERERLSFLSVHQATMVIFLSIDHLEEVVAELSEGYPPETPVAVLHRVTYPDEEVVVGTLKTIVRQVQEKQFARQALIVVGEALGERFAPSYLYSPSFSHGFRGRP